MAIVAKRDFTASWHGRAIKAVKGKPVEAETRTMRQLMAAGLVEDRPARSARKGGKDGQDD